ncbi:hypothetical protein ACFQ0M_49380 [Kitasatospora aburaviensis]
MTDHRALRILRENPELAQLAAYPFNLDLDRTDHVEPVRLASGAAHGRRRRRHRRHLLPLPRRRDPLRRVRGRSRPDRRQPGRGTGNTDRPPCWHDHVLLDPDATDAELATEVAESEEELAEYYGPDLDADRDTLLTALGLRRIPPAELVRRLHRALRRTEPEHLLLNAEELNAYTPSPDARTSASARPSSPPGRPTSPCSAPVPPATSTAPRRPPTPPAAPPRCAPPSTTAAPPTCPCYANCCSPRHSSVPPRNSGSPPSWSAGTAIPPITVY